MVKRFFKSFIFLGLILLTEMSYANSTKAYEKIKPLIFQVKISSNQNLEKSSYGTGFVIDKTGLLVTNYHVVSDAIWEEGKNKIYVQIENELIEAKIKAVDFVNDLSIIEVKHTFSDAIKISKKKPERGSDLYSLGMPADLDWTVVPGTYNGETSQGPYDLIHMSSPINSGMSGGPTVNSDNELVGVNVSGLLFSQQISFSVPARYVVQLLDKVEKNKFPNQKDLLTSLEKQLTNTQEKMTEVFLSGLNSSKTIEHIKIPSFGKKVRCWGSSQKKEDDSWYHVQSENCKIDQSVHLDENTFTGTFITEFSLFQNYKLSQIAWLDLLGRSWNENNGVVNFYNKKNPINFKPLQCVRSRVQTSSQPITINFCYQKIVPFANLYDAYTTLIIPIDEKNTLRAQLTLAGFSLENLKKISKELLSFNYQGSK